MGINIKCGDKLRLYKNHMEYFEKGRNLLYSLTFNRELNHFQQTFLEKLSNQKSDPKYSLQHLSNQ